MGGIKYKYDVFLCHSSNDKDFVRQLYKKLCAVGIRTFFDEKDIIWGGNIPTTIEKAIDKTKHLIVVLSPDAIKSEWVDLERCIQLYRSPAGRKGLILPILYRDCKIPSSLKILKSLSIRNVEELETELPKIVERLGFPYNKKQITDIKKSLTKTIAVFCPLFGASKIYYTELLDAITDEANTYGYELYIIPVQNIFEKRALIYHFPQLSSIDGVIFITCQVDNSSWLKECASHAIPVVLLHDNISEIRARGYTVVSRIRPKLDALDELVHHLVNPHNCHNISVVMTNPKNHAIRTEKLDIIKNAIIELGLDFTDSQNLFFVESYSHSEGIKVVDQILDKNPKIDAIISLADITSIGIIQRLREFNLENQIRVTGFDNIEVADYNDLTTIDQQLRQTGRRALLDLHNTICQDTCEEFKKISYISTTLVERGSCCSKRKHQLSSKATLSRKVIYLLITHPEINSIIDKLRERTYEMDFGPYDTTKFITYAARFPDHITIIGIFSLNSSKSVIDLYSEIEESMKKIKPFSAITDNFQYFPDGTFSIGFSKNSQINFLKIQKILLPIIKKYRNKSIEPDFRQFLHSKSSKIVKNLKEYGEPYVLDLFNPHISILSNLRDKNDYEKILKLTKDITIKNIKIPITEISLLEEEEIGSKWHYIRSFPLKGK